MKIYVWVKGNIRSQNLWATELRAVKLPYKWKGEQGVIRIGVRPIIPYEIGFPADQLDTVLSVLGAGNDGNYILDRYPIIQKITKLLRKFLKLKPVPKPKQVLAHMQPDQIQKAVAVVPIGMKDDIFQKKEGGWVQEML